MKVKTMKQSYSVGAGKMSTLNNNTSPKTFRREFAREYSSVYVVAGMVKALDHFGQKLDDSVKGAKVR